MALLKNDNHTPKLKVSWKRKAENKTEEVATAMSL